MRPGLVNRHADDQNEAWMPFIMSSIHLQTRATSPTALNLNFCENICGRIRFIGMFIMFSTVCVYIYAWQSLSSFYCLN